MERFLAAYPDSPLAAEARALRDQLSKREEAYNAAAVSGDKAALQAFIDAYPTSEAASDARRMLLRFEESSKPEVEVLGQGDARRGRLVFCHGTYRNFATKYAVTYVDTDTGQGRRHADMPADVTDRRPRARR